MCHTCEKKGEVPTVMSINEVSNKLFIRKCHLSTNKRKGMSGRKSLLLTQNFLFLASLSLLCLLWDKESVRSGTTVNLEQEGLWTWKEKVCFSSDSPFWGPFCSCTNSFAICFLFQHNNNNKNQFLFFRNRFKCVFLLLSNWDKCTRKIKTTATAANCSGNNNSNSNSSGVVVVVVIGGGGGGGNTDREESLPAVVVNYSTL